MAAQPSIATATEDDEELELRIPWSLHTREYEWRFIDDKVIGSNTDLSFRNAYYLDGWTEVPVDWLFEEAILEAGYTPLKIEREENDGESARTKRFLRINQPLQFLQVRYLVDKTTEMYRKKNVPPTLLQPSWLIQQHRPHPRLTSSYQTQTPRLDSGRATGTDPDCTCSGALSEANGHGSNLSTLSNNGNAEYLPTLLIEAARKLLDETLSKGYQYLNDHTLDMIAGCMKHLEFSPSCCSNPRLYFLLLKSGCHNQFHNILDAGITDLWLPLHKRLVRRFLSDADTRSFMMCQENCLDDTTPVDPWGRHFAFDNVDQLELSRVKYLGAGGFGEVYHVQDRRNGRAYACKIMSRPVRFDNHRELMRNFKREIMGMRRVKHRHCVDLVASCTDMDSVIILSAPVADMDLASFLNSEFDQPLDNPPQRAVLYHAIGCITSALAYLHSLGIRHDDLKPNNVLVHGTNILLTDFGFCLDSSETDVTTTAGPPTHSTRRYSAPEVFESQPRSRLTDVWSLGCMFTDIVSRILGFKLNVTRSFWLSNGLKLDSYAENSEATAAWFAVLAVVAYRTEVHLNDGMAWLLSFIQHILLEPNRLLRPTATQVLERLRVYRASQGPKFIGDCCYNGQDRSKHRTWNPFGIGDPDKGPEVFFLDVSLEEVVCGNHPAWLLNNISALRRAAKHLRDRNPDTVANVWDIWSQITFYELIKSWHIMSRSYMDCENVHIPADAENPSRFVVQLQLVTLQLERRPMHGAPFIAMVVDTGDAPHERYGHITPLEVAATNTSWHGFIQPYWPISPSICSYEHKAVTRVAIAQAHKLGIMLVEPCESPQEAVKHL